MSVKNMFLSYVELQKSANSVKEAYGPQDIRTVEAYQKANDQKRRVIEAIEEMEK